VGAPENIAPGVCRVEAAHFSNVINVLLPDGDGVA